MRDERGSPLVEFSVMAPLFLMVMFGIVEWGNIFYVQNNMLIAARQAARSWAVDGPPSSPSTTASSTITNACNAVPLHGSNFAYTFTLTYFSSCTGAGTPAGTYGIATMTITTPAAPASLVNYLNSVTGLTLSRRRPCRKNSCAPQPAQSPQPSVTGLASVLDSKFVRSTKPRMPEFLQMVDDDAK